MTLGLSVSILVTFLLIPSLLSIFATDAEITIKETQNSKITSVLANFSKRGTKVIFGSTIIVIFLSVFGISKLEVENSFINYFDKETEIYKGMKKLMMS